MRVKVRIAVVVGTAGEWNACGWPVVGTDNSPMETAIEGLDADWYREAWVTAEIDVPDLEPQEIVGQQEATT